MVMISLHDDFNLFDILPETASVSPSYFIAYVSGIYCVKCVYCVMY